jgi:carboxyl-terminal processing protease
MDQGNIVRTVDRKGANDQFIANHTALTNLPMVVLVDHRSASSSEILTGALKDNQRAVVVGTTTFGKALVQSVHSLVDGSGLAVTVAHYYTPKGTDINQTGISPDINVDLTDSQRQTLTTNPKLIATPNDPNMLKQWLFYRQILQSVRFKISLKKLVLSKLHDYCSSEWSVPILCF